MAYIEEFSEIVLRIKQVHKEQTKRQKPTSFKELVAMDKELLDEAREVWLSTTKYLPDCYYKGDVAVIRILELATMRVVVMATAKRRLWKTSRLLPVLETTYRIKIKEESFYDIGELRYHRIAKRDKRAFLL